MFRYDDLKQQRIPVAMLERSIDTRPAIDWAQTVQPPRWLPRAAYVTAVSQLYHGEIATMAMCRRLLDRTEDSSERLFLETQIADEVRHIQLYERYLKRLGDIAEPEPALAAALEGQFEWRGNSLGTVVAVHLLLEGEGLRVQREYGHWFPCNVLRQINSNISPDEARHVAFGRRTFVSGLSDITQEERIEIYRWLCWLWRDCALSVNRELPGLIRLTMGQRWINDRWARHEKVLIRLGLVSETEAQAAA